MKVPNRYRFKLFSLIVLSLILIAPSIGITKDLSPWSGKVVGVSDGDTITVMKAGKGVKVRLSEIDCPESGQPFGSRAKQLTSNLCYGKVVMVKPTDVDRYGRIVAHVILPDGRNLNEEVVKAGLAWQYKQYSKSAKLAQFEAEVRKAKIGIWSMPNPVPPWEWRSGSVNQQKSGLKSSDRSAPQASAMFHGNVSSKIFHASHCEQFNCKNCTAKFNSRDDAIKAGYRPCKICKP